MAVGWTRDEAVQEQIDATVAAGVQRAKSLLPVGESLTHCAKCRTAIPAARREAMPGVQNCVGCQARLEQTS